mmetsp:Transcript_12490/g.18334  ORF Transcript_12490/g.18334 Transcript_12490/m.18334 type:complete len:399 (-) Transcript_12490:258-1454(-)|eukprot:CAMPEP_0194208840 /NCGR_PEP_ID=MMETSP0156-20130528/7173_1 /TAXON_ID=33649 /ORGANISM="Thalassionema nitzschioides, Strain L26-B" /LENGTH=398 /DNA_ID=CAMNT_0038935887 /DNA_START=183 /DNA_END=1379 /DNA_ORIENTATION=-
MRERLGTDDTILICNIQLNSQEDGGDLTTSTAFIQKDLQPNPKLLNTQIKCNSKDCESLETRSESKTISITLEEDGNSLLYNSHNTMSTYDDDTVVSSLSKDEDYIVIPTMAATLRHSLKPIMETCHLSTEKAPPYEVSFEKKSTINGAETSRGFYSQQQEEESSQVSLSASSSCSQRMDKLVANLAMTRSSTAPTLLCAKNTKIGTHLKSRPSVINRSQSLPVTKTEIAGNNPSSYSGNALLINGALMEGIRPRYNGDVFLHDENDLVYNPHAALVGDRKQRRSHRSLSVGGPEIFVGNLVGQSTLLASSSPLATDSSDASLVRRALFSVSESKKKLLIYDEEVSDGSACCQARQPQSTMKKELKYMVSKVTTPLRAVKLIKDKKANLQRSAKGCLV